MRNGRMLAAALGVILIFAAAGVAAFEVADVQATYERLRGRGVEFFTDPTAVGTATIAVFDDTCGNLIQIFQAP